MSHSEWVILRKPVFASNIQPLTKCIILSLCSSDSDLYTVIPFASEILVLQ